MTSVDHLLSLSLSVHYGDRKPVLKDLVLNIRSGEILGLVGGSGSGKSTIALAILRLLDIKGAKVRGQISFKGRDLTTLPEREMRHVRGREISLVLQSPSAALNPMLRIRTQMREVWCAHRRDSNGDDEIARALESVSLPACGEFLRRYPSELSIGQGQRVLIAMAILHSPSLLIADEATSALDSITQSEILDLFRAVNKRYGTAVLFISHDLSIVASMCERVAVLHEGRIIDCDSLSRMQATSVHPYIRALLTSSHWSSKANAVGVGAGSSIVPSSLTLTNS